MCHTIPTHTYSQYGEDPYEYIPPVAPQFGRLISNIVDWLLTGKRLVAFDKPVEGLYVNLAEGEGKTFLHLLSTPKRELEADGIHLKGLKELVESESDWPNCDLQYGNPQDDPHIWDRAFEYSEIPELAVTVRNHRFSRARMAGIESPGWKELPLKDGQSFTIPAGAVGRYAYIELES
jgi:hypothetical protein